MEDNNIEYRRSLTPTILNSICAFLNTDGGTIKIGYSTKGEVIGVPKVENTIHRLNELVRHNFLKDKLYQYIHIKQTNDSGHDVICITIDQQKGKTVRPIVSTDGRLFFMRISGQNKRVNHYQRKQNIYNCPAISEYEPSDALSRKNHQNLCKTHDLDFKKIGTLPHGNYLYKYMDLESALKSLEYDTEKNKIPSLRFVEPTSWDDQYEGRFYGAIYNSNSTDDMTKTPFLYACCFSTKRENEAAWILYSHNKKGLASRCVQFIINRSKLREQLIKNLINFSIFIGPVEYKSKKYIDQLHLPLIGPNLSEDNTEYHKYFDDFSLYDYLNLLLLKRETFEHEQEVRIFLVPRGATNDKTRRNRKGELEENPKAKYVEIDWLEIIEGIKIDENCTEYEKRLLEKKIADLIEMKKTELSGEEYDKLQSKCKLSDFAPYKDESVKNGPIEIETN